MGAFSGLERAELCLKLLSLEFRSFVILHEPLVLQLRHASSQGGLHLRDALPRVIVLSSRDRVDELLLCCFQSLCDPV